MKKFSLFAILLGFNIALGACSDDDAAPVVKRNLSTSGKGLCTGGTIQTGYCHQRCGDAPQYLELGSLYCLCSCCTAGLVCQSE